eukprot:gene4203-5178_t
MNELSISIVYSSSKIEIDFNLVNREPGRRDFTTSATYDTERFTWKGAGSGSPGELWEEPGLYVEATPGIEWFFLDVGKRDSREPICLLLHGMPAFSYLWRNVLPILSENGRRAIAVDLPGFGNSTCPQVGTGFGYTIEEYVDGLAGLVK